MTQVHGNMQTGYPFNGSDDPVYQETMSVAAARVDDALSTLRIARDMLDGHDETAPEYEELNRAIRTLEEVAADHFEL